MVKSKSVPALVLGILAILGSFACAIVLFYIYIIGSAFSGGAKHMIIFFIMMIMFVISAVIGIIGAIFSLHKSKISGILYSISAILCAIATIWLICVADKITVGFMSFFIIFLFYTLATIFGFCAKSERQAELPQFDALPANDLIPPKND